METPRQGVADRLADTLRAAIVKGRLQPGEALPSERDLAERYDVNRSSVREAVKRLDAWGLVHVRHGGATRVRDFLLSAGIDLLPHLVEASGNVDPDVLNDLHDVRAMLLGYCAEEAARRADPASVARLDEIVRKMAGARPTVQQELDYEFFQQLVAITGNRVLALFANVIRDVYMAGRERFLPLYDPSRFTLDHHIATVAAIRARDPLAAGDAMRTFARSARTEPGDRP